MAQVTVTISGSDYQIACDDGQELHLKRLGEYVDKRAGELAAAVGKVGDSRLLVMTSLLLADELSDLYAEMESMKANAGVAARMEADEILSESIENLALRIETIAEGLEQS